MNKIRTVVSLFDGISCGQVAINKVGIPYNKYYASEIEDYAISVTQKNYPNTNQLGDVTRWKEWDIDWSRVDLILAGFPCFVKGTTVVTDKKIKLIENISVGDYVLTHKNRFKKVLHTNQTESHLIELKCQGILKTVTTPNHPYYVRSRSHKWNNDLRKQDTIISEPYWKNAGELIKGDYVGLPILKIEENPLNLTNEDCWLLGRYIADGHLDNRKRKNRKNSFNYKVIYSIGSHKLKEFQETVSRKLHYHKHTKSVHRGILCSKDFVELIKKLDLGRKAIDKNISMELLKLPKNLLKSIIEGYMSGDGHNEKHIWRATTISKVLIQTLTLAIAKVYGTSSTVSHTVRPKTTIIEGRTVNQNDTYTISFSKTVRKHNQSHIIDGIVWLPFRSSKILERTGTVYNMEVEEDNSYTANMAIVHNCQSHSIAGRKEGLNDPRGQLVFDMMDILKHCRKFNPDVKFLFENVIMKKDTLNELNNIIGVDAIKIDSGLVSAQTRRRNYWSNLKITQPKDRKLVIADILDYGNTESKHITDFSKYNPRPCKNYYQFDVSGKGYNSQQDRAYYVDTKFGCLPNARAITKIKIVVSGSSYRNLTLNEVERLQTLPDNYTYLDEGFSLNQSLSAIGNGWNVDTIAHFLEENFK